MTEEETDQDVWDDIEYEEYTEAEENEYES